MRYRLLPVLVLVLSACGGGSASSPEPSLSATTPEGAVRLFFQAVADSNVAGMARLWGTSNGPALVTGKPADYAPDNVPYQPRHWLKISTRDLDPGDLVLLAGYPARSGVCPGRSTSQAAPRRAAERSATAAAPLTRHGARRWVTEWA